ncbi:Acyltransferase family protein [Shewanella khirikhana]|uniref:Acyltransferase family protein n=2 Tax=Shewanella khirikhana TaxID=1965282 RepID=A0ABN5TUL5_9GAMM|nr:Acyltransferase family protein [Shewanella khirikhana]
MALSIMIYHYLSWQGIELDNSDLIGKLGVYAVAVFYILSGISLGVVYLRQNSFEIKRFYIKRLLRIWPLYFFAVLVTLFYKLAQSVISGDQFNLDTVEVFLNLTLLFGFFSPDSYVPIGGWSIGNEMVFYLLFPLVVLLIQNRLYKILWFLYGLTVIIFLYYALFLIEHTGDIAETWSLYVHPANHFFLFFSGVLIGHYIRPATGGSLRIYWLILFIFFFVFTLYPVDNGRSELLAGWGRVFLTSLVVLFLLIYYYINPVLSGRTHRFLSWLGDHCYSIYILHPLVYFPIKFLFGDIFSGLLVFFVALLSTFLVCFFSFKYIEKPFLKLGFR